MNHQYGAEDRCMNCDCRPWGKWASLPCGATETAPFIPADPEKEWQQFLSQSRVWSIGQNMGR
jgi:hypothetical protein